MKDISAHGLEDLIVMMSIWPTVIYGFDAIPIKTLMVHFANIVRNHPKNHMGTQENTNSQNIFEKEKQTWRTNNSWFQCILQSYSNQNSVLTLRKTYRPRNKIEGPEIYSCLYTQMIFNKGAEATRWRKGSLQQTAVGKLNTHMLKNKTGYLHCIQKLSLNGLKT